MTAQRRRDATSRELDDERAFLLRSLEDLQREHEAGDLSDDDLAALRDRYTARAATVLRSLDATAPPAAEGADATTPGHRGHRGAQPPTSGTTRPGPARRRRILVTLTMCVVIGVAGVLVVSQLRSRLPGQSVTGSIALGRPQQVARTVAQAETLENEGEAAEAVTLYESVLRQDPTEEDALAEAGWLEFEAGVAADNATLLARGRQHEQEAERVDASAFAPHLYLGSMLLVEGDASGAVAEYRQFLADHPPQDELEAAAPFIAKAAAQAHVPAPTLPPASVTPRSAS